MSQPEELMRLDLPFPFQGPCPPRSSGGTAPLCLIVVLSAIVFPSGLRAETPRPVDFSRDILPILSDNCFLCHGPDPKTRKADLRLDTKEGALRVHDPVIVPSRSAESELILRIVSDDKEEVMPPPRSGRKLSPGQIELLKRWVDEGAPWGRHWAYEPPRRPDFPRLKNSAWVLNPIDAFILARLEHEGLTPTPQAGKETLIRRVTLDLTGVPPSLEEVDAFLADQSPRAYEKVVDRLLASPRYGERMAWDWLDAARYADSNGYQGDQDRTMWPWRDWVVRALNDNMPYDRFTIEQLAGDLLPNASLDQRLATAFNRNHMINGEGGRIPEENRVEYVMDQVETTGTVWLGITLNCARCHDHKFDPFSQRDYYRLSAYFNQTPVNGANGSGQAAPVIAFTTPEQAIRRAAFDARFQDLAKQVQEREKEFLPVSGGQQSLTLPQEVAAALREGPTERARGKTDALIAYFKDRRHEYVALLGKLEDARKARDDFVRALPRVMVMEDEAKPRDTFVLVRGAYNQHAEKVAPGVSASLSAGSAAGLGNRLALARWITAPDNPLTARVAVNRAWQLFFGTGLVKSAEDFGVQGEKPSHPELIDWLATEFVNSGWDVKALHRLIVTSATYRQSSKATPSLVGRDPENRLLARGPRFRMPSWMIRDQALAASGLLAAEIGGPPVNPYQPPGVWEEATFGNKHYRQDTGDALYRRSVYTFWRRIVGPTAFFDTATRQTCVVKPTRTNTPLHALTTLNDVTYVEAARSLAERAISTGGPAARGRLERAFRFVLSRGPTAEELGILLASLSRLEREFAADPAAAKAYLKGGESPRDERIGEVEHAAYAALCLAIFNLDEALTKE